MSRSNGSPLDPLTRKEQAVASGRDEIPPLSSRIVDDRRCGRARLQLVVWFSRQ
jgi:hypothetical protein